MNAAFSCPLPRTHSEKECSNDFLFLIPCKMIVIAHDHCKIVKNANCYICFLQTSELGRLVKAAISDLLAQQAPQVLNLLNTVFKKGMVRKLGSYVDKDVT